MRKVIALGIFSMVLCLFSCNTQSDKLGSIDVKESAEVIADTSVVPLDVRSAEESAEDDKVYEVVEEDPEFPGGRQNLVYWLSQNLKFSYAASTAEYGCSDRIVGAFIVNRDGSISDPEIIIPEHPNVEIEREFLRVLSAMPRWKPGKQRGKAVRVKYTLPINIRLQ